MILVDTSVWVDFFRGTRSPQAEWLDRHLGDEGLVIGDLIMAEVLQGFRDDRGFAEARRMLSRLEHVRITTRCIADGLRLLHGDRDFAAIARHLPLQAVDRTVGRVVGRPAPASRVVTDVPAGTSCPNLPAPACGPGLLSPRARPSRTPRRAPPRRAA